MTQSKAQASSNRQQTSDKPNGSLMSDKESEAFERGKISGLQEAILAIMGKTTDHGADETGCDGKRILRFPD